MSFSRPSNYPYPRDLKQVKDVEDYMKKLYAALLENDRAGEYLKDRSTDADLKDLIVRPEWYGAKGDGTTDDTTAIQAAIDAMGAGGTIVFGPKTYKTTGLITFSNLSSATIICNGRILNDSSSAILFNGMVNSVVYGLHVYKSTRNWDDNHYGVAFTGETRVNRIFFKSISGFNKGVYLYSGESGGIGWNEFHLGLMNNNKYAFYITNTSSTGWCNQNSVYGGSFRLDQSVYDVESDSWGVYFGDYTNYVFQSWNIIGSAFETLHGGCYLRALYTVNVVGARFEAVDTWIDASIVYGLTWNTATSFFDSSKIKTDPTYCRGWTILGGNIQHGDGYGSVATDGLYGGLTIFEPVDLETTKWRLYSDSLNYNAPVLNEPFSNNIQTLNKQYTGTVEPTSGTYQAGAVCWNSSGEDGSPVGWKCSAKGTMGTLSGVTGSVAAGQSTMVVNTATGLQRGMMIDVAGDSGTAYSAGIISRIDGTTVYMTGNAGGTATNKAVTYHPATWVELPPVGWVDQDVTTSAIPYFAGVYIDSEGTELCSDGGLEDWASATNLTSWSEYTTGTSSINREGTEKHGGAYSCRMDIDASNSVAVIYQEIALTASSDYRLHVWYKTEAGKTAGYYIGDSGGNVYLKSDGSWSSGIYYHALPASTDWALVTKDFTTDGSYANYAFYLARSFADSSSIYYDDISVVSITKTLALTQGVSRTSSPEFNDIKLNGGAVGTSGDGVAAIKTGTAPSTSPADEFQLYSADITAGNAAPHFRTENGSIVKLYKQVLAADLEEAYETPELDTEAEVIAALNATNAKLNDLITALQNTGLLASS